MTKNIFTLITCLCMTYSSNCSGLKDALEDIMSRGENNRSAYAANTEQVEAVKHALGTMDPKEAGKDLIDFLESYDDNWNGSALLVILLAEQLNEEEKAILLSLQDKYLLSVDSNSNPQWVLKDSKLS